ncbi:uncharacterized protein, partial [Parasteatoda tepidariorum]|uniref:uncharacterized protein n=1 Tax=Parasteatoda tepidariorum TaxID=114398 RepID=UPI001C728D30
MLLFLTMAIRISNYQNNESINVSLPLISGEIIAGKDSKISIKNLTSASKQIVWPVINGRFKALIPLKLGKNEIELRYKNSIKLFSLNYKPLINKRFIRLVYIKCKDDPGLFQSPVEEDNSIDSACKRISLAGRMLQTFTLDKLREHNLKGKSFRLEEINEDIKCHVFTSSLSLKEAYCLNEQELWSHFAVELMNSSLRIGNRCKFLAFLSFTRYINNSNDIPKNHQEVLNLTKGQVALGGGGLALFGSGCLHTWPETIQEIPWRFGDNRKVDRMKLMDDSANRGFYWACYSTGLGAALHELGHTFDLGHTHGGIMGRGFDDIHKYFIIDMFYKNHIFQQEHNPYYQPSNHDCTVELTLTSPTSVSEPDEKYLAELSKVAVSSDLPDFSSDQTAWKLPNPPDTDVERGRLAVNVGGAYWSRSSALILYFHKWFNDVEEEVKRDSISLQGTEIVSSNSIKIIEFRDQEGTSFHHLEFLEETDIFKLNLASINLSEYVLEDIKEILIVVEDIFGNLMKSK